MIMDHDRVSGPRYDISKRDQMRRFLQKAAPIIDVIASDQVPFGSPASAVLVDQLAEMMGLDDDLQMDDFELQKLKDDRQSLVGLYAVAKKNLDLPELYRELGILLREYGLFDEEVVLLENAIAGGGLSDAKRADVEDRLKNARQLREADLEALLEQCTDDAMLYEIACKPEKDPGMNAIRGQAARKIQSRDYRYALSSHILCAARTSMILDQFESLEGDDLFIARTILTDPNDVNKLRMLLYCKEEALLMLGWRYVYGAKRTCADNLHEMGSRFPEAYQEMDPQEKSRCEQEWLAHAAELALDILSEDDAVRERLSGTAEVDSDPLHFFLSIHHPRLALRWWHAKKLENPVRIAYVGSWTSDDQIKETLSEKISSTVLITEMIYGDLSGVNLVFGFRKPDDLTLQDRFCVEIMKNNPDRRIREHVRTELLKGNVEIPGVDLTKPDPFM